METNNLATTEKRKMKRKSWTKEETRLLLACYKNRIHEFTSRRHRFAYANVLKDMFELGFEDKTVKVKQLEGRMKTLLDLYKHAKKNVRKNGGSYKSPFMNELEKLFAKRLLNGASTTTASKETGHLSSTNVGKTTKNKCRLCLRNRIDYKNLFDGNGRATAAYSTVIRYFDPMQLHLFQEYANQEIVVCLQCWSQICEFDSFKSTILLAQTTMNETNPKKDGGKTLERIFGKQQGYDPLGVCNAPYKDGRNEAHQNEYSENDDNDHDMSDPNDIDEEDLTNSYCDTNEQTEEEQDEETEQDEENEQDEEIEADEENEHDEENEEDYEENTENDDIHDEEIEKEEPPKLKETSTIGKNQLFKSSTPKQDLKYAQVISVYGNKSNANEINTKQSYCDNDATTARNYSKRKIEQPEDFPDDLDGLVPITRRPKPKFMCDSCGKRSTSLEAIKNHECAGKN